MGSVIDQSLSVIQPLMYLSAVVFVVFVTLSVNPGLIMFATIMAFSLIAAPAQTNADLTYYQQCTNHSTLASCRLSGNGTCDNVYGVFSADPEWAQYKQRLCDPVIQAASKNRLLNSYSADACVFGACDQECTDALGDIQLEILAYGCPASALGVGVNTIVDPGEVITMSPLYGPTFRVLGWTGLALILVVLAYKFGRRILGPRT
jgi:hypothetical protein